jgi:hypothetical protein
MKTFSAIQLEVMFSDIDNNARHVPILVEKEKG